MKDLQLRFGFLFLLTASVLAGGLVRAEGFGEASDPVKTCSVGPIRDIVAIDQLWNAYAYNLDLGDAEGVANLFTEDGGFVLLYNDRTTKSSEKMGYSPTTTGAGTDGDRGGGCTALGHNAIVNFLDNIGLNQHHTRAT